MTATLTCVDLDRTIIYSPNALALTMEDEQAPRLLCVEVYRQAPLSFLTERAAGLLAELSRVTTLVPVTTRTPEQFRRVKLPVAPVADGVPRYAITSNGGQLLVDGRPDADWSATVTRRLASCAPLREIHAALAAVSSPEFIETVRIAADLFVYAVVQREKLPIGWVEELSATVAEDGWTMSVQGRKVYLVPAPLTKSAAMAEVKLRIGAGTVLAAGDSLLDQEMLQAADLGVRPAAGELASTDWSQPHIHQIAEPGVIGGERLIEWLLTTVTASGSTLPADARS